MKPKKAPKNPGSKKVAARKREAPPKPIEASPAARKSHSELKPRGARKKLQPVSSSSPKMPVASPAGIKPEEAPLPASLATSPGLPANVRVVKATKKKIASRRAVKLTTRKSVKTKAAVKVAPPAAAANVKAPSSVSSPANATVPVQPDSLKPAIETPKTTGRKVAVTAPELTAVAESAKPGPSPIQAQAPKKKAPVKLPEKPVAARPSKKLASAKPAALARDAAPAKTQVTGDLRSPAKQPKLLPPTTPLPEPKKLLAKAGTRKGAARRKQVVPQRSVRAVASAKKKTSAARTRSRVAEFVESELHAGLSASIEQPLAESQVPTAGPATVSAAAAAVSKKAPEFPLPPILFEGDEPMPSKVLSPEEAEDLPESYGAGHLLLVPRDPTSIYAAWDLPVSLQEQANKASAQGHMVLLVWQNGTGKRLISEIALHKESRHWFVHVPAAGASYACELGYYDSSHRWVSLVISAPVQVPGSAVAVPAAVAPVTFTTVISQPSVPVIGQATQEHIPPTPSDFRPAAEQAKAPPVLPLQEELRAWPQHKESHIAAGPPSQRGPQQIAFEASPTEATDAGSGSIPKLPPGEVALQYTTEPAPSQGAPAYEQQAATREWTREMEGVVTRVSQATQAVEAPASLELVELENLIRRAVLIESETSSLSLSIPQAQPEVVPGQESLQELPSSIEVAGAVPGGVTPRPAFWLKVNTELVIYGSTDPYAKVTIGGHPIQLRKDGTFSFRFSLPNGAFSLPVKAVSMEGDTRGARLSFSRDTKYSGEVGIHPQDPKLLPPKPENV